MDDFERSELTVVFLRWLEANPMHTTLFGKMVNLHDNRTGVLEMAEWMTEQVIQAVEWTDRNS